MNITPLDTHTCSLNDARKYLFALYLKTGGDPDVEADISMDEIFISQEFHTYPSTITLWAQKVTGDIIIHYNHGFHRRGGQVYLTGNPTYDVQLIELAQQAHALHVMHDRQDR